MGMQPVIERRSLPNTQLAAFLPQDGLKLRIPLQFLERHTLLLAAQPVPGLHKPRRPQIRTLPHPVLMLQPLDQFARPCRTFQTIQRLPDLRLMLQRRPQIRLTATPDPLQIPPGFKSAFFWCSSTGSS